MNSKRKGNLLVLDNLFDVVLLASSFPYVARSPPSHLCQPSMAPHDRPFLTQTYLGKVPDLFGRDWFLGHW